MQDTYNDKQAQEQTTDRVKNMAQDAQNQLKQGKQKIGQLMGTVDKQVRDNPWPVIAGVALGAFLLGSIIGKSTK